MLKIDDEILDLFETVSLGELDKVALLNRIDIKYVFNASLLEKILTELKDEYYMLEIDGKRSFEYSTMYYDTMKFDMFNEHIRGKLNRFKVRHRVYVDSGLSYLEVKFKNNKNRTIKWRTKEVFSGKDKSLLNENFLEKHIPYKADSLKPSLQNKFLRLTLVDKNFTQRVTLDFKLGFNGDGNNDKDLHQIAIAELKIDKSNKNNTLQQVLRKHRIQPSGFSKYCIGKSLSTKKASSKQSSLKPKLLKLNKIANDKIYTN